MTSQKSNSNPNVPRSVIIVDSDINSAMSTEGILRDIGVTEVEICLNGQKALDALKSKTTQAIVIEWKLKDSMPAFALISRIRRSYDTVNFPIVLTSGIVQREELKMVQDFQCLRTCERPLRKQNLADALKTVLSEHRWYTSNEKKVSDIFLLKSDQSDRAVGSIEKILSTSPNPAPLALLVAKYLVNHRRYNQALDIYNDLIRKDPQQLPALSGKAKLLSRIGHNREALAVLNRAYALSPKNIDRLHLMGDLEISLKRPEDAIKHFQIALGLDVKDVKSRIGLTVAQNFNTVTELQITGSRDEPSIATLINNLGVQLALNGSFEKALKYYIISFGFLANDALQAKVSFNIGIGFKKWGKLPQAKFWFERSMFLSGGAYPKAQKHLIDMNHITAIAGINDVPIEDRPIGTIFAPDLTVVSVKNPAPPKILASPKSAIEKSEDSIFDEESIGMANSSFGASTPAKYSSLGKMIDSIDQDLEDLPEPTFDEAI